MKVHQEWLKTKLVRLVLQNAALAAVLALASLGAAAPAHSAGSPPAIKLDSIYVNARFGFSVHYPGGFLTPGAEPDNGDGVVFHTAHGSAEMRVWGNYNVIEQTPVQFAQETLKETGCDAGKAPYKVTRPNLIVVSCAYRAGSEIFYQKTIVHGDVMTSVEFRYPASEHATWNPLVANISKSLKGATDATGAQGGKS